MNLAFNFSGHGMTRCIYAEELIIIIIIIIAAVDPDDIYMIQLYDIDSEKWIWTKFSKV